MDFQRKVFNWMLKCFGDPARNPMERAYRFFEEATELVQACGMSKEECQKLLDYTFGRPVGEKSQEVGGVMVTLAGLCGVNDCDMMGDGEVELDRIWRNMDKIRAKQKNKPHSSPLPQ